MEVGPRVLDKFLFFGLVFLFLLVIMRSMSTMNVRTLSSSISGPTRALVGLALMRAGDQLGLKYTISEVRISRRHSLWSFKFEGPEDEIIQIMDWLEKVDANENAESYNDDEY
jgi:hypothetical protein